MPAKRWAIIAFLAILAATTYYAHVHQDKRHFNVWAEDNTYSYSPAQ